ncbi:MAG TPA: creatininase family protein [candidate division Zixibacteria bacterium]|nr:creatininase family protein [candidate division Zixibacteria bacterium]
MKLARLTWQEFGEIVPDRRDTAILPVGTIEAHGVTSLAADVLIPEKIADEIADRLKAVVLPSVPYGITRSLYGYPGSLTVKPATFETYISGIIASCFEHKFKKLVILNGHGGNSSSLNKVGLEGFHRTGLKIAVVHWWMLAAEVCKEVYGQSGGHAALDENAFILAYWPELVKKERYKPEMVYPNVEGIEAYPNPGSIITYAKGEGYLDFDPVKAKKYALGAIEKVAVHLADVFRRWEAI